MKQILGSTLPELSGNDQEKGNKGLDFIGINHYTSFYVKDCIFSACEPGRGASKTEGFYLQTSQKDGVPIGQSVSYLNLTSSPSDYTCTLNILDELFNLIV